MINRRAALLLGSSALAGTGLASCNVTPSNVVPTVIDTITSIIASTCQIIPVVASLVDVIVAVFPGAAGVASITDADRRHVARLSYRQRAAVVLLILKWGAGVDRRPFLRRVPWA
jgi:hypothetical protein